MEKNYVCVDDYFHKWAADRRKEVQAMEKAMEEDPRFQDNGEACDIEKQFENLQAFWRKGLSEEDWKAYRDKIDRDRSEIWRMFIEGNADYGYHFIFDVIRFKLEWVIFYWENFGHLARADHDVRRMRIAVNLLDIILNSGYSNKDTKRIPYVNKRNASRFRVPKVPLYCKGVKRRIRFCKAYCLLLRYLEHHLLGWWN